MEVTSEEVTRRLESTNNLLNFGRVQKLRHGSGNISNHESAGRRNGDIGIPPIFQEIIGTLAKVSTVKEVSEKLSLSHSQVQSLKEGKTTNTHGENLELKSSIVANLAGLKNKILDKAAGKLLRSLDAIKEDEVDDLGALKASELSRNLAGVMDKMTPKNDISQNNVGQIIVFAPQTRSIESYPTRTLIKEDV